MNRTPAVRRLTRFLAVVVLLTTLAPNGVASGHELDPGFLQVTESEPGTFAIMFKVPTAGGRRMPLQPIFPTSCADSAPLTSRPNWFTGLTAPGPGT